MRGRDERESDLATGQESVNVTSRRTAPCDEAGVFPAKSDVHVPASAPEPA